MVGVITIWRLPKLVGSDILDSSTTSESSPLSQSSLTSLKEMLSDPGVLLALTGTMFGAVCQGFIETFLESYLALFGLTVAQIGVSFLGKIIAIYYVQVESMYCEIQLDVTCEIYI